MKLSLVIFCGFYQLFGIALHASDLGCKGKAFPVLEENFAHYLEREMEAIPREKRNHNLGEAKKRLLFHARNPMPVSFLREAEKRKVFYFDPSYIAKEDVKDSQGEIVVQKGQKVNPLEIKPLSSSLLFFDGNNRDHVAWARKQAGNMKWILTRGSPIALEEEERRPIYFDQRGTYSTFFHLEHIPARVSQDGNLLVIEEIPIKFKEDKSIPREKISLEILELASQSTDSIKKIEKKCSASSWVLDEEAELVRPSLFVLISFSVPIESWKWLSKELEELSGAFVLNGIPNGSFQEFASKIQELRKEGVHAPIQIDPIAFEQYGVEHVPTIVISRGKEFDKVVGNIPLSTALNLFKSAGALSKQAKELMESGRRA